MPRLLFVCPRTHAVVPTGHRTTTLEMAGGAQSHAFRCAGCGAIHTWTSAEVQIEKAADPAGLPSAA